MSPFQTLALALPTLLASAAAYWAGRRTGGATLTPRRAASATPPWDVDAAPAPLADRLGPDPEAGERSSFTFVAIAEIDRFKSLRRRVGYSLANELIAALSARLRDGTEGCQVGRVGRTSIEFAFTDESRDLACARLARLVALLERPIDVDGHAFDLSVTVGAADAGDRIIDDLLLDRAAAALVEAQERHEKIRIADADTQDQGIFDHLSIMRDLRRAMVNGELALHYQPKLRSRTESIDAAEALLRWHHAEHGLIRTDKFIEVAEATGAIREVTYWVIERAIVDQARLAALGHPLTVFVNISGMLLPDRNFAAWVLAKLADANGAIGFEITETAVIEDPTDAIANLQQFADAGIKIAIDDYGSGLSSLAYLKQLPAHELKIDRMFVSGLTESHRDPLLVRSSIDLAHALEMEVTAEGVDDPLSLSLLRIMGCDLIQGYLISPPLPLAELELFLRDGLHRAQLTAPASALDWSLTRAS